MGILASIFGSGDIIEKGIGLIDSFHTSDTELIEAKAKAKTDLLSAYAPFKVTQRYLAIMFAAVFLASFVAVLGMTLAGIGKPQDVIEVVNQFWIGEIMGAIIAFYFGGGFVEGAIKSRK